MFDGNGEGEGEGESGNREQASSNRAKVGGQV